jgi:hypothetical protein
MQVIDKRGVPLTTTVGDLAIGEAFTDCDGDINIKIGIGCAMYWDGAYWIDRHIDNDMLVIPLEVTYTFEREESKK